MINRLFPVCLLLLTLLFACKNDPPTVQPSDEQPQVPDGVDGSLTVDQTEITLSYPAHFSAPDIPADNPLTATKVALGKRLFFEPSLSADGSLSCGGCHFQENAFSDPRPFSPGVGGVTGAEANLRRNAPPLFNLAWHKNLFWDGAIEDDLGVGDQLENQSRVPIEAPHEMNSNFELVIERLNADSSYVNHFFRAFGDSITPLRIMQAIASFERSMISADSKYDQFVASGFDSTVLTASEYRGYQLYFAETGARHAECFHCHGGFNFDDPSGAFRQNGFFEEYEDFGRYMVTAQVADFAKFKVPSLRNIEYTAPYMHDGSVATLEEVLDRYVASADEPGAPNRDPLIGNIILTEQDKQDVIAFLKTLSDPSFLTNPAFQAE